MPEQSDDLHERLHRLEQRLAAAQSELEVAKQARNRARQVRRELLQAWGTPPAAAQGRPNRLLVLKILMYFVPIAPLIALLS